MSASVQSNVPAELRQEAQAHYIKERDSIIPRFYNASMHDAHLDAKVVYDGMPIVQGGETLTIGLVPPERRWAIGEVQDGWAACINQQKFDELCKLWKQQEIQFKSQGTEVLDFPDLEPRPNVRDFVAWKVHKTDPSRLIRLGMPHERQVVRQGTHVYDPETDTQMTRDEWAAREKDRLGGKANDARAMEARIAELEARLAQAGSASPVVLALVDSPAETFPTRCGRGAKSKAGAAAHERACKKCSPDPTDEAA
jgi:hypothetical protein